MGQQCPHESLGMEGGACLCLRERNPWVAKHFL